VFPVAIPTLVQKQGSQTGQGIAGGQAPLHPTDLLAFGDEQVIGFFDMTAANMAWICRRFLAFPIALSRLPGSTSWSAE
jgi:hypothetical protein